MRLLILDAALPRGLAAIVADGHLRARRTMPGARGHAAQLAPMAEAVLAEAGVAARDLDAVAATIGPGSFTGLRAALALAHGIAAAIGRPVIGVTVPEAFAAGHPPDGRTLWVAIHSRRGRVFLHDGTALASLDLNDLPGATGIAVAGDAAIEVAARLAARGADVRLTDQRLPEPLPIAAIAARRLAGALPPLAAQPLYVDAPEARLPAAPRAAPR